MTRPPWMSAADWYAAREMRTLLDAEGVHPTLRAVRESLGYSQTAFGRLLGQPQANISQWELGKWRVPERIREAVFALCGSWISATHPKPPVISDDDQRLLLGAMLLAVAAKARGHKATVLECGDTAEYYDRWGWPWNGRREVA